MGILGDGHLSFHRALHTNYARISRKRMKNGVAQMDGSLGNQPADLKPPALQKTPWMVLSQWSQIPIDLGLFGRWFVIFPMENPPWLGNRLSECVLFFGGPLKQIQVDTLQTMNNSELVNVDNPIPSSWLSGWVSSHPRIDLAISKWTIPSPPNVFSPIGWYQYPNTGWCPPVMCVAL